MRAIVVEANTLSALRVADALEAAGFLVVGSARSSGEAFLLANLESPDIVVLGADLEASGAGRRLADKLERDLQIPSVVSDEHATPREHLQCGQIVKVALQRRRRHA